MRIQQTKTGLRRSTARRGAILVEFVFVVFLLIILIFGIIEVSLVMKNQATVAQAAREAARSASVGSQPNVATQRAITTATGLTLHPSNVALERSTNNGQSWTVLQTTGSPVTNDAAVGDLVRATVTYKHSLVTGFIYTGGSKQLSSTVVMRRE